MNWDQAMREIEGGVEDACAELTRLLRLERRLEHATQAAPTPRWAQDAAVELAEELCRCIEGRADGSPASNARIIAAIRGGPAVVEHRVRTGTTKLEAAMGRAEALEGLRLRVRATELRLRCLDHLEWIFGARRAQP